MEGRKQNVNTNIYVMIKVNEYWFKTWELNDRGESIPKIYSIDEIKEIQRDKRNTIVIVDQRNKKMPPSINVYN